MGWSNAGYRADDGGWYKNASAPSKTFTFRGQEGQYYNPAGTVTFTTINIGTPSADRYVILVIESQNPDTLSSVTVGGVSLASKDIENTSSRGLAIFSGLVTTGSGVQTIIGTSPTAGIFTDCSAFVWVGTGMTNTSGAVSTATGLSSASISVNAGDFLVAQFSSTCADNGSTQAPTTTRTQLGLGGSVTAQAFEWNTIAGTNAAFSIAATASPRIVAAAYR